MCPDCAGGLEKPATPEPKLAARPGGDAGAPWRLAGASPTTPASLRAIQDQEAAAGSQVGSHACFRMVLLSAMPCEACAVPPGSTGRMLLIPQCSVLNSAAPCVGALAQRNLSGTEALVPIQQAQKDQPALGSNTLCPGLYWPLL